MQYRVVSLNNSCIYYNVAKSSLDDLAYITAFTPRGVKTSGRVKTSILDV